MQCNAWSTRAFAACFLIGLTLLLGGAAWGAKGVVKLAYVEWSSEIASTNLVKAVLQEEMGYRCEIYPMKADEMWQAVAKGEVDAMVAAWLPQTHCHFYENCEQQVVNLGPNLEGAKTGLVVPNVTLGRQTAGTGLRNKPYITVDSIAELPQYAEKFHHMIVGIDPEAGIMKSTEKAIQVYGLEDYELIKGSEQSMTKSLANAIQRQDWIVVTGWVPHWMFARWELKFLKDPENVYGDEEHINTVVRQGFKEDMPEVYAFLDNFYWQPEEMGQLMIWINEDDGMYPYEKALRYMRTHHSQIQSWIP